jgi:hypothetical protein
VKRIAVLLALLAVPAGAQEVRFEGQFVQGGLVVGTTQPGASVTLDGQAVRVSPDGPGLGSGSAVSTPNSSACAAMLASVQSFHDKHNFKARGGEDLVYRVALMAEELGEIGAQDLLQLAPDHRRPRPVRGIRGVREDAAGGPAGGVLLEEQVEPLLHRDTSR